MPNHFGAKSEYAQPLRLMTTYECNSMKTVLCKAYGDDGNTCPRGVSTRNTWALLCRAWVGRECTQIRGDTRQRDPGNLLIRHCSCTHARTDARTLDARTHKHTVHTHTHTHTQANTHTRCLSLSCNLCLVTPMGPPQYRGPVIDTIPPVEKSGGVGCADGIRLRW